MNVRFPCPECDYPSRVHLPGPPAWQCPACDHRLALDGPADEQVPECVVCGTRELYKRKDFPHQLGLLILTVACAAALVMWLNYWIWQGWAVLLGVLGFDILLFRWVGDVTVCYRCHAEYRTGKKSVHPPFDLGVGEKYRQERLRREQLRAERQSPAGGP